MAASLELVNFTILRATIRYEVDWNGDLEGAGAEAIVKITVKGKPYHAVAESGERLGAFFDALQKALSYDFPWLNSFSSLGFINLPTEKEIAQLLDRFITEAAKESS